MIKFKKRIEILDRSIKFAISTIDPSKRKIVGRIMIHFHFFAKRYGFEVIGAVKTI